MGNGDSLWRRLKKGKAVRRRRHVQQAVQTASRSGCRCLRHHYRSGSTNLYVEMATVELAVKKSDFYLLGVAFYTIRHASSSVINVRMIMVLVLYFVS